MLSNEFFLVFFALNWSARGLTCLRCDTFEGGIHRWWCTTGMPPLGWKKDNLLSSGGNFLGCDLAHLSSLQIQNVFPPDNGFQKGKNGSYHSCPLCWSVWYLWWHIFSVATLPTKVLECPWCGCIHWGDRYQLLSVHPLPCSKTEFSTGLFFVGFWGGRLLVCLKLDMCLRHFGIVCFAFLFLLGHVHTGR